MSDSDAVDELLFQDPLEFQPDGDDCLSANLLTPRSLSSTSPLPRSSTQPYTTNAIDTPFIPVEAEDSPVGFSESASPSQVLLPEVAQAGRKRPRKRADTTESTTPIETPEEWIKRTQFLPCRQYLFEHALARIRGIQVDLKLTMRQLVTETLTQSVLKKRTKEHERLHEWLTILLNLHRALVVDCADGLEMAQGAVQAFCRSSAPTFVDAALVFLGVTTKGKKQLSTKPPLELLELISLALVKSFTDALKGVSFGEEEEVYDSPAALEAILEGSQSRVNPTRGFRLSVDQRPETRPCRQCERAISQFHKRKVGAKVKAKAKPKARSKTKAKAKASSKKGYEIKSSDTSSSAGEVVDLDDEDSEGVTAEKENEGGPANDPGLFYRRRTMCDAGCVYLYRFRSQEPFARECVGLRDSGVCAECGLETQDYVKAARKAMAEYTFEGRRVAISERAYKTIPFDLSQLEGCLKSVAPVSWTVPREPGGTAAVTVLADKVSKRIVASPYKELYRAPVNPKMGLREGDVWQADHIVPVVLGGGEAISPLSFRTLCFVCHKAVSKQLASVRSHRRRPAKVPARAKEESQEGKRRRGGGWLKRL